MHTIAFVAFVFASRRAWLHYLSTIYAYIQQLAVRPTMKFPVQLFSFEGAENRTAFWKQIGITFLCLLALMIPPLAIPAVMGPLVILYIPVVLLLSWVTLALCIRRLRDRGKSAYWVMLMFVPLLGPLWLIWELGIRGSYKPS